MRFVILHYHILKNAGSTIEEILDRNFGERFSRLDTLSRDGDISNACLLSFLDANPHVEAVSSHQIRYPVPCSPGYLFFDLCILRDPVDRIRSMYDYFRAKPAAGDPVSESANRLGLGEFVACLVERFRYQVNDVQVKLLAHGIVDEPVPGKEDLEQAAARMLQTSFLGVVDRFDESLVAGRHLISPVFPGLDCAQPPVNVTKGVGKTLAGRIEKLRAACIPRVFDELLSLNDLDSELLSRAREEVERRFRMVPDRVARLRALREQAYT